MKSFALSLTASLLVHGASFYAWDLKSAGTAQPIGAVYEFDIVVAEKAELPAPYTTHLGQKKGPKTKKASKIKAESLARKSKLRGYYEVQYPDASKKLGETGTVELRVKFDARGELTNTTIEKSSGFPRLDEAALKSLKTLNIPLAQRAQYSGIEKSLLVHFKLRAL